MAAPSSQLQAATSERAGASNDLPLAIQALVQNQLDQILIKTHKRRWETWHHEDFRLFPLAARQTRKQSLLKEYPGLLSGFGAASLNQITWQPLYILSITVPRADLKDTAHGTDLRVCNVVWGHSTSGTLSLSFFNNHLDPTSGFRHLVTEGLSTKRSSQWAVGKRGVGFTHACRWLEKELFRDESGRSQPVDESLCSVALRVGYSVGKLAMPQHKQADDGKSRRLFTHVDLSLFASSSDKSRSESTLPSGGDASIEVVGLSQARRVDARSKLRLSVSQDGQERPLVHADEVLVTITGLDSAWTPEDLFSGIWSIFPPAVRQRWTIPSLAPNLPEIMFYKPRAQRDSLDPSQPFKCIPRFYFQGYRVSSAPLNMLGIVYWGYLDHQPSPDGSSVTTRGTAFDTHPGPGQGDSDRYPEGRLASLPYTFGEAMPIPENVDEDGVAAYRAAFEAAFRELDASLSENEERQYYPYLADSGEDEKKLIAHLGLHPVPVQAHVKQLLEKVRAYPPVRYRAEALLLSSPGVQEEPRGADMLRAALSLLFPALGRDILSVRNYAHGWPHAAWNKETRSFVEALNALLRCTDGSSSDVPLSLNGQSDPPSGCVSDLGHGTARSESAAAATGNQLEDEELEYLDPPPPSPSPIVAPGPAKVPIQTSSSPEAAQSAIPPSAEAIFGVYYHALEAFR
ncbi:hypothetical protein ONZ51_g5285 [Trametes cubensis]|uniref:Uncharacterized protein n=1 Tax=Trametes cubensis TaxID=1111947 RepID=A0AAD7X9J1_9APHY|nr:hypothetical protein ONZ51_g5285 [Trametes cubensis]